MLQPSRSVNIDGAVEKFAQILRDLAPYRTGNLAENAIRFEKTGEHSWKIYVHTDGTHSPGALDGIAPYQVYLNEYPTLFGKKNDNYKWWEAALELALEELAREIGGSIEQ